LAIVKGLRCRVSHPANSRADKTPPFPEASFPGFLWLLLYPAVVFLAIDCARCTILLTIDLPTLGCGKFATIFRSIISDFFVDGSFALLEICSFSRRQLSALHALGNALLLIALALTNFTLGIDILYLRVVLLLVNIFGKLILLLVQRCFICSRQ